ncbi:MAG TPA: hypothetical protein VJZ94_01640, partial [Candidatus Paceibacterota bacterium]|nr:hypothetical protein [Candidatus Paceibacterota bacterium]
IQRRQPLHSSLLNFGAAIRCQRFSADKISRWFSCLVERDDYTQSDRRFLLAHFVRLSRPNKRREEHRNKDMNARRRRENART